MDNDKQNGLWRKPLGTTGSRLGWLLIFCCLCIVVFIILSVSHGSSFKAPTAIAMSIGIALLALLLLFFIRWLMCWRNFRRFLIGLACAAILVVLFYAEENWRGKHAWEKYKAEQIAKGEKFDLKEFIPIAPPIDQNFATTPVIASCYEELFDTSGHLVQPRRTNVVDRLEMLTALYDEQNVPTNGNWVKGTVTDLSAWQNYYRRSAAITNLFPIPPAPQTPAADVLFALSKYNATLDEVRAASRLPYAQFPLEYDKENPAEILLPHLARLKGVSRLLQLRAIAELQAGQSDQALADTQLSFFFVKSIRIEPFLISQLVRLAITDINLQPIYEGLADHRWTDAQLIALDADLAQLDFPADFEYSMHGERIFDMKIIDYLRRTRTLELFDGFESSDGVISQPKKALFHLIPAGFFYQSQVYFCQLDDQWIFPIIDPAQHIVSPAKVKAAEVGINNSVAHVSFRNQLATMLYPSVLGALKRCARVQSAVDLARGAIALERYHLAHGEFPDSLDPLTPQFINAVPHDLINGKPLNYHRTADDQFTLYSVGWNETDDGGTRSTGKETLPNYETNDLVWAYPAK